MKQSIRKPIIFILFILCNYDLWSQDCPALNSHLPDLQAEERIKFFNFHKKNNVRRWDAVVDDKPFSIDTGQIKKFLRNLTSGGYDGLRVYFAFKKKRSEDSQVEPGEDSRFSLVLIPTKDSGVVDSNGDTISTNDSTNAYFLSQKKFRPVNLKLRPNIVKWMTRYQTKLLPKIEQDLRPLIGGDFVEDSSLWYAKEVLFKSNDSTDLLSYLSCPERKVDTVRIHFASWTRYDQTEQRFWFKMDLIFELVGDVHQIGEKKFFTLGAPEIKKKTDSINNKLTPAEMVSLDKAYGNTGLPCPPNKCPK